MPLPDIPPGLEKQANAALDVGLALLTTAQPDVLASDGRYWQGLRSHSVPPNGSNATAPDRLDVRPSDRTRTWRDLGMPNTPAIVSLRCDEYEGPLGKGWTVTAEIGVGGRLWARAVHDGPETWRAFDWQDVTPEDAP